MKIAIHIVVWFVLFVLLVVPGINDARAEGVWTPPDTIDQNNNPLEIAGGGTFFKDTAFDTFIVLNEGPLPLKTLQVYNVIVDIEGCVLDRQSSIVDFDGPIFGSSHTIVGVVPSLFSPTPVFFSSIIDNFRLKVLRSDDGGITWTVHTVANGQDYGSSEVSVDLHHPTKLFVGGCNFNSGTYDIFEFDPFFGNVFNLVTQVLNVQCALTSDVIRSTFAMIYGTAYTLFGRETGGGMQDIVLNIGSQDNTIDQSRATPANTVDEVYLPVLLKNDYVVGTYYNGGDDTVKAFGVAVGNNNGPVDVRTVGQAPPFTTFFGISAFESSPGIYDIIFPGGNHFQFNSNIKQSTQINTNGNFTNQNGPIGASQDFNNLLESINTGIDVNTLDPTVGVPALYVANSVGCGIFIIPPLTIPTLSEWGFMLAAIVLLAAALFVLRRRSKASEV